MLRFAVGCCAVSALVLLTGCGKSANQAGGGNTSNSGVTPSESPPTEQEPQSVKKYAPGDLEFGIGVYMPRLEGGRLEVAPPQGWDFGRAGSENVVAFFPDASSVNSLPRIIIKAEDCPYPEFSDVNASNVEAFAKHIASTLEGEELANSPQPLLLGDNAFSRHVSYGRLGRAAVAQQYLLTVKSGRLYTVSLEVHEPQFKAFRDAGYAAGASMRFSEPTGAAPVDEPADEGGESPKTGPPAETKADPPEANS